LAIVSKHLYPGALIGELVRFQHTVELFITHLKPGQGELIMQEIEECVGEYRPRRLEGNHVFEF